MGRLFVIFLNEEQSSLFKMKIWANVFHVRYVNRMLRKTTVNDWNGLIHYCI